MAKKKLSEIEKLKMTARQHRLAVIVYRTILHGTETFEEEEVGADLAYLMGAILTGDMTEWSSHRPLVELLKKGFSSNHEIWNHIIIDDGEPP